MSPYDVFINLRSRPLQSDYIWGFWEFEEKYTGYKINDVLSGICRDWKINAPEEDHCMTKIAPELVAESVIRLISKKG